MSEPGYIYALINRSMPGLVKVGKTLRAPAERLDELSSATGVPTAFELVYDVLVPDCDGAERFLHAELTRRGYRFSHNREFFQAPIREVVRLLVVLREMMESAAVSKPLEAQMGMVRMSDPILIRAAQICIEAGYGSTLLMQRAIPIGFARANSLTSELQVAGVLGPATDRDRYPVKMTMAQLRTLVGDSP